MSEDAELWIPVDYDELEPYTVDEEYAWLCMAHAEDEDETEAGT